MYVNMSVRMFVRINVHIINLPTIRIVWKFNVDAFTCKTRHYRLKIGDLAGNFVRWAFEAPLGPCNVKKARPV